MGSPRHAEVKRPKTRGRPFVESRLFGPRDSDTIRGMKRREFLRHVPKSAAGVAASAMAAGSAAARRDDEDPYRFKLGIYMPELDLPFDEELAKAKEIGAEYVWFNRLKGETDIARISDAEADRMAQRVERHGLKIFLLNAGNPFKGIHLTDLALDTLAEHPAFRKDMDNLVRSMQIASRIGVSAVGAFSFAWPGEYSAGKPTWPMRWMTRGGVIAENEMDKLVKAFSMVAEQAERHGVDVAVSMMPWNYTNTTANYRRVWERVGSKRLKVMWGPADNWNCGEADVATAGFQNIRPYLHGLHLKDVHVIDGHRLKFEYRPLGDGNVDYPTIFKSLRDHRLDVVLSVSTHFRPPSGSRIEAMEINYGKLKKLLRQVEQG